MTTEAEVLIGPVRRDGDGEEVGLVDQPCPGRRRAGVVGTNTSSPGVGRRVDGGGAAVVGAGGRGRCGGGRRGVVDGLVGVVVGDTATSPPASR